MHSVRISTVPTTVVHACNSHILETKALVQDQSELHSKSLASKKEQKGGGGNKNQNKEKRMMANSTII